MSFLLSWSHWPLHFRITTHFTSFLEGEIQQVSRYVHMLIHKISPFLVFLLSCTAMCMRLMAKTNGTRSEAYLFVPMLYICIVRMLSYRSMEIGSFVCLRTTTCINLSSMSIPSMLAQYKFYSISNGIFFASLWIQLHVDLYSRLFFFCKIHFFSS